MCGFRIQEQGVCGSCVRASTGNARDALAGNTRDGANTSVPAARAAAAYTRRGGGRRGLGIFEDSSQPRARLAVSRVMSRVMPRVRPSHRMHVDKPTSRENVAGLRWRSVGLQELPV